MLELTVKNFRAVNSAEIKINGITVLSGINGCGKSTLSKLLYTCGYASIFHDKLLAKNYAQFFDAMEELLLTAEKIEKPEISEDTGKLLAEKNEFSNFFLRMKFLPFRHQHDAVEKLINSKLTVKGIDEIKEGFVQRLRILSPIILKYWKKICEISRIEFVIKEITGKTPEDGLKKIEEEILAAAEDLTSKIEKRYFPIFRQAAQRVFSDGEEQEFDDMALTMKDCEETIISSEQKILSGFLTINDVIYINDPMVVDSTSSHAKDDPYCRELLKKLKSKSADNISDECKNIIAMIANNIDGRVLLEEKKFGRKFIYKRQDGKDFSLEESASGVKNFGILQMLLANGYLNSRTLLIIDEPEVNLHPQWIVEYAVILLELVEKLGVRILIATHSPDMLAAIDDIGKSRGLSDKMHLYLGKKAKKDQHKFDYQYLKNFEVDKVFEEFNISYEKIREYKSADNLEE
jgi:predicted ATPase